MRLILRVLDVVLGDLGVLRAGGRVRSNQHGAKRERTDAGEGIET